MTKVSTACGMCNNLTCGLIIETDGRKLTGVRGEKANALSRGRICVQAKAALELQTSPLRLERPLKKVKSGWRPLTWDEALRELADRFGEIRAAQGGRALALYQGHSVLTLIRQGWSQRFLQVLGSGNMIRNDHLCHMPTDMVQRLTYGHSLLGGLDPDRVGCVILWGNNPATSAQTTLWHQVRQAVKQGAPLVVIDPRRDRHTDLARLHLSPRPGTDGALALGLIREIIAQGWYDRDLVDHKALGFERLQAAVEPCDPAWTADRTGLARADIQTLLELVHHHRPLHLASGNALEHHTNSFQTLRAISIFRALAWGLDRPGGNLFTMPSPLADMSLGWPGGLDILGQDRYPLFTRMQHFAPGDAFMNSLLEGRPYALKGALMMGGNPMLTWPQTDRVGRALQSLETMVVVDTLATATTELADFILPAASFWEKDMLLARQIVDDRGRPRHNLFMMRRVLDPGQRRSDFWILSQLARRMGFTEQFPWTDDLAAINALLQPLGLTHDDIPDGGLLLDPPGPTGSTTEFDTPSGKIEFFSLLAQEHGYNPLPDYSPPRESPENDPQLAQDFPLVLNAGGRHPEFAHSQFRHLACFQKTRPQPEAEIHPRTAAEYNVRNGDKVSIETRRGRIEVTARLTKDIMPGVVGIKHGWSQANANALTDFHHTDPVGAMVALRSGLCRIRRVDGEEI